MGISEHVDCPVCDGKTSSSLVDEEYMPGLIVTVLVHKCSDCSFEFTGESAEIARDTAAKAHRLRSSGT